MIDFATWWCNDLSIFLAFISLGGNVFAFFHARHESKQVKINSTADIYFSDNSKLQITISNIGKINTKIGKIGIEFRSTEKWYKVKSGGISENLYFDESFNINPVLAAGETVRINMDLNKICRDLKISFKQYKNNNCLIIDEVYGWVYLARDKKNLALDSNKHTSSKSTPLANALAKWDSLMKELEDELNDPNIKKFHINFSESLKSYLLSFKDKKADFS